MRKTMLFATGAPALMLISIAPGQQGKRVDDAALRNAGKAGQDWLSYGVGSA